VVPWFTVTRVLQPVQPLEVIGAQCLAQVRRLLYKRERVCHVAQAFGPPSCRIARRCHFGQQQVSRSQDVQGCIAQDYRTRPVDCAQPLGTSRKLYGHGTGPDPVVRMGKCALMAKPGRAECRHRQVCVLLEGNVNIQGCSRFLQMNLRSNPVYKRPTDLVLIEHGSERKERRFLGGSLVASQPVKAPIQGKTNLQRCVGSIHQWPSPRAAIQVLAAISSLVLTRGVVKVKWLQRIVRAVCLRRDTGTANLAPEPGPCGPLQTAPTLEHDKSAAPAQKN
jgi:hypothetical protein